MPDDIISLGGSRGHRARDGAGETIESVFAALYLRLVNGTCGLTEDTELAEELVLASFVRLARRSLGGRRGLELDSAAHFLQRAVTRMSSGHLRYRGIERRARQRRLKVGQAATQAGNELAHAAGAQAPADDQLASPRDSPAGSAVLLAHHRDASAELPDASAGPADTSPGSPDTSPGSPDASAEAHGPPVDVAQAWRDFRVLRARSAWRLRGLMAAGAVVVALAIALPVVAAKSSNGSGQGGIVPGPPGTNPDNPGLNPRRMPIGDNKPIAPPVFEDAIVARIELSGVVSVVGATTSAWAIREIERAKGGLIYQLDRIDLRTNRITMRLSLGRQPRSVAAGAGMLWLTTARARAGGQLVRIDPATGRVRARLHLPAGRCGYVGYSSGHLVANCQVHGPFTTDFLGIDPATGRVLWQEGSSPVPGQIGAVAVAPQSVWYVVNYVRNSGLTAAGGSVRAVRAGDPAYRGSYASNTSTRSLAYGRGAIWVLGTNERVARIDPVTGVVKRVYTGRSYDPQGYGGLSYLAVGNGALWFLDDGHPFSGVLRVSPATGRPVGLVAIPAGSCGQQACGQIYLTPGAVWVPTQTELIRIDPTRMPAPDLFPETIHHELAASRPYARTGGGTVPALHVGSAP